MANTYITVQENPKYSENLLPTFAEFNDNITWNVVEGGSNAVAENNSAKVYAGERALLFTFTGTGGITIDKTDELSFVAPQTGNYIVSIRAYVQSTYSSADINFRMYSFINAVNTNDIDFNVDTIANGFQYNKWNTFYQVFPMEAGDVFDCQLKAQSTEIGAKIYLDGFKIELDDRGLGIPSRYTPTLPNVLTQFSFDYNNAGASQSYTTGELVLQNDGAGSFTNIDLIPTAHANIYNTTTDTFDFSSLNIGDVVLIRLDLTLTTTVANQIINSYLELGQGVSPYPIMFHSHAGFKTIDTYDNLTIESRITILNDTTKNNPAQFKFNSDDNATVIQNGFNITVLTTT